MQVISRSEAKAAGLKQYFTGKACKHGHVAQKQTSNGECLWCAELRPKAPVDPLKKKANGARYYAKHKEKLDKRNKEYYEKNKDRLQGLNKQWAIKNKDSVLAYKAKWHLDNSKEINEKIKIRKKQNPDFYNNLNAKRRAAKRNAIPIWADSDKTKQFYLDKPDGMQVDHVVPLISDLVCGLHVHYNLQYLTPLANAKKGNFYWPDMP